jgi:hypothetical protein
MDGSFMELVAGGPRTGDDWSWNNAAEAVREFIAGTSAFVDEEPAFPFSEGLISEPVSYWRRGYLKRIQ